MKYLFYILFLACFLFVGKESNSQGKKPNIIIFLVDDMGWQDCSLPFWDKVTEQNRRFHTPNMERLASQGIKLTNAYANAVCTPTRVSIMTGMNEARHMVTNWTNVIKDEPTDYPDSVLNPAAWNYNGLSPLKGTPKTIVANTLPQLLKENGYRTIHCGKAHFAPYGTPASEPLNIGFDVNIGGSSAGHPGSYLGEKKYRSSEKDTLRDVRGLEFYAEKKVFLTEALTMEAIYQVKRTVDRKQPFFLYMSHYAVHLPFEKDKRFYQKYIDAGLTENEAKYAALVEGMDKSLGDIMDYLKKAKLDKNTYILFLSDNGGLSLAPPRSAAAQTQNLPLKQGKGSLYEGGIRVPMIVAGPGIQKASISSQYLSVDDMLPTVLAMAGIKKYEVQQVVDGENMLPYFKHKNKVNDNKILIWHYPNNWTNLDLHGISWMSAIRQGDWKLIYFHKTGELELYNLKEDISENNELSKQFPEKRKAMAALLTQELKNRKAKMPSFKSSGLPIPWPDEIK